MPVYLIDKIKQKNGKDFPLLDAADVLMPDGKRLDKAFEEVGEKKTAVGIDLSGYENGTIVETYEDGSTLTYHLTFDEEGRPTKIEDSSGNETVITW